DDALVALEPWDREGMQVHSGFKQALNRIWPRLSPPLEEMGATPIWFAGHSLGAALATLAADRCAAAAGLVTLGSPRVGDAAFAAQFDARFGNRALRFVNNSDVVTHAPPPVPLPYAHVGELRQISRDGSIGREAPRLEHFFTELVGSAGHLLEVVEGL